MSAPPEKAIRHVPTFFGVFVRGMQTISSAAPMNQPRSKLQALLGLEEWRSRISYGAALTEFNFTFMLEFMHVGLVRAAGDFASPVLVIAVGKFIVILLCMFAGAASGAHMNPNISLATVLLGFTTISRCIMYTIAQVLGAICGIAAARAAHGWDVASTTEDLGGCGVGGSGSEGAALVGSAVFFHFILCIIGGVAFDDRQGEIFGPIVGPICISSAVAVSIFASAKTAMLINWGECLAIGLVGGEFNGSEWVAFLGPTLASIAHAVLFVSVPPSQAHGRYVPPLFRRLQVGHAGEGLDAALVDAAQ